MNMYFMELTNDFSAFPYAISQNRRDLFSNTKSANFAKPHHGIVGEDASAALMAATSLIPSPIYAMAFPFNCMA